MTSGDAPDRAMAPAATFQQPYIQNSPNLRCERFRAWLVWEERAKMAQLPEKDIANKTARQ
jgi:hypothetical protein